MQIPTYQATTKDVNDAHNCLQTVNQDTIACFRADTPVLTRNIRTNAIASIPVSEVYKGVHEVFCTSTQAFVPVIHNIVTGRIRSFMRINKDLLGVGKPDTDFYITAGHPILIDGKEVLVQNVPGAINQPCDPQYVFSICTPARTAIRINGLDVMTWAPNDWYITVNDWNIIWVENKARGPQRR